MQSSYPTLSVEDARKAFDAFSANKEIESIIQKTTVQREGPEFDEAKSIDLSNVLWELVSTNKCKGYTFEQHAASLVHQRLELHPVIAGDKGFWRWLTFSVDGQLADLVKWRYQSPATGYVRDQYYGFGQLKQGMFAYLWLRAQAVFHANSDDPYELSRLGDVDIWQSHIVRIDFGSVPQLARAFIRFVFPNKDSQFLNRNQYRELAKEITRRNASMAFELLDTSESLELISEIWEQLNSWKGS